jgi:threonine synthase
VRDEGTRVDLGTGLTTLHRCERLGEALGLKNLYVKDDTVNPTARALEAFASVFRGVES